MRSATDRIRQAIAFEAIGLILSVPLAALTFGYDFGQTGVLGIICATVATVWNYIFNLGFDHGLRRFTGSTQKSLRVRFLHAISFDLGLMIVLLPLIAWWMEIGMLEALILDIAFVGFYLVYAFVFTWCYDTIFPDTETSPDGDLQRRKD